MWYSANTPHLPKDFSDEAVGLVLSNEYRLTLLERHGATSATKPVMHGRMDSCFVERICCQVLAPPDPRLQGLSSAPANRALSFRHPHKTVIKHWKKLVVAAGMLVAGWFFKRRSSSNPLPRLRQAGM